MANRDLTEQELAELAALNQAVTDAIARRREWLDAKMVECSEMKVGDDIYNVLTGENLGKITRLYRYWRDRDEGVRDTTISWDYEYELHDQPGSRRHYDNTSRQMGAIFGPKPWEPKKYRAIDILTIQPVTVTSERKP